MTPECIANCFRKAGISTQTQENAVNDEDDPFQDLQESLDELKQLQADLVPNELGISNYYIKGLLQTIAYYHGIPGHVTDPYSKHT